MLDLRTKAPAFTLVDETGEKRRLSDYVGKWVVLYFYPKDDTPGCTKEACMITEVYEDFQKLGVVVLGMSKDSPASHQKFKEKYHLPFTLLADESTKVMKKYGAWQERSLYGRKFMGTARITYIIDPKGKIARTYPKVSPATHAVQLLKDLLELMG